VPLEDIYYIELQPLQAYFVDGVGVVDLYVASPPLAVKKLVGGKLWHP
jgi:hypothetical protein